MSRGDSLAITGPSGSGKSTLLYIIGTLESPSGGQVSILGEQPFDLKTGRLAAWRNSNVGFVFQDHHLLPQCSVLENVLIPTLAGSGATKEATDRATGLLERVGLRDRMNHRPAQISGGERQRVAVCRALINQPALLLADEPTGNLDQATAEAVGTLLLEISTEHNAMLVCVTHSRELANRFPRHVKLDNGKLVDA
ncbi:UNVERIFIED_CONTAM: hypothetical protein GTU68_039948 [Idotea baltica]|nr:hypothetical protein [Idotea baltica]